MHKSTYTQRNIALCRGIVSYYKSVLIIDYTDKSKDLISVREVTPKASLALKYMRVDVSATGNYAGDRGYNRKGISQV